MSHTTMYPGQVKAFLEEKFPTHLGGIYYEEEAAKVHDRREELSYDAIVVGKDSFGTVHVYIPEHSVWVPKKEQFVQSGMFTKERQEAMEAILEALEEKFQVDVEYYQEDSVYDDQIMALAVVGVWSPERVKA